MKSLIIGCEQSNSGSAGGVIRVPPECLALFLGYQFGAQEWLCPEFEITAFTTDVKQLGHTS